jgi:hypothetical protein
MLDLMVLLTATSFSQSAPDSTRRQISQKTSRVMDQNGDGINDGAFRRQPRTGQGMDRFIDLNGDGISDSRECGLGFRRGGILMQTESGKPGMGRGHKK